MIADARYLPLKSESVNCVVTSPPYWGLRKYDIPDLVWDGDEGCEHEWINDPVPGSKSGKPGPNACIGLQYGDAVRRREPTNTCGRCGAWRGQLGLEPSIELYLSHLLQITKEIWRVLRKDGVFFVNIGDSYAANRGYQVPQTKDINTKRADAGQFNDMPFHVPAGLKPKDLCLIPFRLALALQAQGWWVRSDIIWAKPNPMPESVKDRPTRSHEYLFLLTKNQQYFWDQDAVREPHEEPWRGKGEKEKWITTSKIREGMGRPSDTLSGWGKREYNPNGRNIRSVWTIATQPYPEAHYACVDEQTECLTQDGWKTYNQIEKSDLIASYDKPIKGCRWSILKDIFTYQVENEEMVRIKGRCVDQLLTKNHRCIVKRRSGKNVFVEAESLKSTDQVITASEWLEENSIKFPERLASIIGWAITEGNFGHDCVTIYQSGDANPEYCKEIEQLLIKEGATFIRANRKRQYRGKEVIATSWRITGALAHEILSLCPNKQLPPNFLRWNLDSLYALWDAMIKGDGNFRQGGRTAFVQKDKKIIDDVQALATRLGYSTTLQKRSTFTYSLSKASHQYRHLRDYRRPIFGIEKYTGIVWCPRTEFETFVARRNGKVFITGNTFPEELVERCIKAGCPKGGTVLDPFAGSGTVQRVAEKLNRIGIGFDLGYEDLREKRLKNNQKVLWG